MSIPATLWARGDAVSATIADVSGGGMLLVIAEQVEVDPGEDVHVGWSDGVRLEASVRHARREGDRTLVGVCFTSMSEAAWLAIHSMLLGSSTA